MTRPIHRATPRESPATVARLCRELQAQILLVSETYPDRLALQVSRRTLERWHNTLARVVVLWLEDHASRGGARLPRERKRP